MGNYKSYRHPLLRADGRWMTSDLYTAAFLAAKGNEIAAVELTPEPGRFAFVIDARSSFEADWDAWRSNDDIPIQNFLDFVYQCKALIRENNGRT